MARRVIVQRTDDLDHRLLTGDGQTITFSYQGVKYEIDLCADNAKKLTTPWRRSLPPPVGFPAGEAAAAPE